MSESSVTSARRPVTSFEDFRSRNNQRAKDYYYKNHETVKTKMRERAATRRGQTQETIRDVTAAVADIQTALDKVSASLQKLTARVSPPAEISL